MIPPLQPPPNPRRRTMRRALVLTLVFVGAMLIPAVVEMDMMNGGYALVIMAGFAAMSCLVTALVYLPLARNFDQLFAGDGVIAEWRFDPEAWRQFTDSDFAEESGAKKGLWWMVSIIIVVVSGGFVLVQQDEASVWVAGAMLGVIVLLRIVATVTPRLSRRAHQLNGGRILIGRNGVWQGGVHHAWNTAGSRLERVGLGADEATGRPWLVLTYSYPTRAGMEETAIRLPVPDGNLGEAHRVTEALLAANPGAVTG
jgi:hypothetical protein